MHFKTKYGLREASCVCDACMQPSVDLTPVGEGYLTKCIGCGHEEPWSMEDYSKVVETIEILYDSLLSPKKEIKQ